MCGKIKYLLLISLMLVSCSRKEVFPMYNIGEFAMDSTLLFRNDSTVKFYIGERITPKPLISQFIEDNMGNVNYILLDENILYKFNTSNGKLVSLNKIENCGNLNSYSGFLSVRDTTFIYNYNNKILYMLDSTYTIKKKWSLIGIGRNSNFDPEALTDSPILHINGNVILSGVKLRSIRNNSNLSISCNINTYNNQISYGCHYPEQYVKGNFGDVYLNFIYHAKAEEDKIVYSFPTDHYVYFYSSNFEFKEKKYMGSRYAQTINSSDDSSSSLFKDKEQRIRYYINQNSYSNILYDKYRNVYYRIAQHPLSNWKSGEKFIKPFSIIVMDVEGNLLTETSIQKDYFNLNLHNMHVTKEGLLIQKETTNENIVEFIRFTLK